MNIQSKVLYKISIDAEAMAFLTNSNFLDSMCYQLRGSPVHVTSLATDLIVSIINMHFLTAKSQCMRIQLRDSCLLPRIFCHSSCTPIY